ncbi:P-loop containing nucleoside triphosphate hydrolase protein [Halteromyces radiatus]|uniref:P-loop containing nucleoside triphosphate hydrolase protein n=1 Tax=Halteromyces radiatus TaxID=101107 RepID=UPI00221E8BE6|nr:P-loop containing nucleoside triphosphate hydrolase protein [Halteromyces radiatus]KAI8086733.1 P-loop containing nucleoside triphosphate hydrolase protein [Halteromyces radiatus]
MTITDQDWINRITCSIGGYDSLITYLVTKICTRKAQLERQCTNISKGVVLHGKPGTGKTALALALAKTSNLPYYVVNGPDIFQTEEGASENRLRSIFTKAAKEGQENKSMVLVIVDEWDMLAGIMAKNKSGLDTRITSMMQSCIDQLDNNNHIFLLCLTNRLHAIDPCFLRSGRMDDVQELVVKLPAQRLAILSILTSKLSFSSEQDRHDILSSLANQTHGFVPSDLSSLCSQIVLQLVRQEIMSKQKSIVQWEHVEKALSVVHPSNMNAFTNRVPSVRFSDLYGIDDVIEDIKTSVIYPFKHPEHYLQLGISPPRGIMLHGPTGTGKTMLCSALALESGVNFVFVESTQLRSKIVGESEKNIAAMFAHARSNAPCILFIDQIDMLLPMRGTGSSSENTSDRIVTGFLTEMDGLLTKDNNNNNTNMESSAQMDVLVVAATNRLHAVDSAVLRPGRFDEHIQLSIPTQDQRFAILRGLSSKMPLELTDLELKTLASTHTQGWSGAELDNLLRESAMICLRENVTNDKICIRHIDQALLQRNQSV